MKGRTPRHRFVLSILLPLFLSSCDGDQPSAPDAALAVLPARTAPTSLSATAVSHSEIVLAWGDNATDESGWEVHRSTTGSAGPFALRAGLAVNATTYRDGGLASETEYCYKVRSFRTTGRRTSYSGFSGVACATTAAPPPPPPPPTAPTELNAAPYSSTAVDLRWRDNSSDEEGFRVERSSDLGATWALVWVAGSNQSAQRDGLLSSEQQVCYRVIAFNGPSDSEPSNTACTTPPAGPTNLGVTYLSVDSTGCEAELTWTDNSGVEDGYEVWYWVGPSDLGEFWLEAASLPANTTRYTAWSVYCSYYVVARKDGGYSDWYPNPPW